MSEQLELPLVFKVYDIFTDTNRRLSEDHIRVLHEVYKAYGQVRWAIGVFDPEKLVKELNKIHFELQRRIREPD
jgi:hypothetical protein